MPDEDQWALELKRDGCRAQLRYDGRSVALRTRHGRECIDDFPELAEIAGALGDRRVTLDAELVCLRPDGRPDFQRLRRRLAGSHRGHPAMLQVFDVLHLDGRSTRTLPFRERRALLEELVLDCLAWRTPATLVGVDRLEFIERVATLGLEGVVAKRLDSIYSPGRRTRVWIKHKLRRDELLAVTGLRRNLGGRVEAVFVARRLPDGSMAGAGSIKLGLRRELVALRWNNASPPPGPAGRPADLVPRRGVSRRVVPWLSDGPVRDAVLRQVLGTDH